jgi:TonB family protein
VMFLVQRVWKAPPEIALIDRTLKTTYLLRISRTGELLDKKLLISSGNSPYDRSVHLALSSLKRLPQPPLFMVAGQDSVEVTMSFTPPKGAN